MLNIRTKIVKVHCALFKTLLSKHHMIMSVDIKIMDDGELGNTQINIQSLDTRKIANHKVVGFSDRTSGGATNQSPTVSNAPVSVRIFM